MAQENFLLKIKGEFEDHISDALRGLSDSSIPGVITALSALAGAIALSSMSDMVRDAIDAGDALSKLSQRTGVAVEELSKWQLTADLSDVSTQSLANGFKQLSKNIIEAQDETSKEAKLFDALGISLVDANGKIRKTSDVMGDLAEAFKNAPDDANKLTVAMELMGKSGTDLIPALNGGKQAVEELAKVNKDLGLYWEQEQTKQAEAFNDSLTILSKSTEGFWQIIAKDLLPVMSEIAISFAESAKEGGLLRDFFDGLATMLSSVIIPVITFLADTLFVLSTAFHIAAFTVAGFAATITNLLTLNFSGVKESLSAMTEDIVRVVNEYEEFSNKLSNPGTSTAGVKEQKKSLEEAGKVISSNTDKAAKMQDEYAKALTGLKQQLFQINNSGKTSEVIWNTLYGQFAKFSEAQKQQLISIAKEIDLTNQLQEVYNKKGEWFDEYSKKIKEANDKLQAVEIPNIIDRAGEESVQKHIRDVDAFIQKQQEKIKGYDEETKAILLKRLAELRANETSEETLENYRKIGEQIAQTNEKTEVWINAVGKNRENVEKLNNELVILDELLKQGKISQEEYTGAVEKNSAAQLNAWANQTEANARFKSLILDDRKAMADAKKGQEELTRAFEEGKISVAEYNNKMYELDQTIRNIDPTYTTDIVSKLNFEMQDAAAAFEGMFSDYIFDAMQGKWNNLGDMVKQVIDRMVANMLAAQLQFALFGDLGNTPAGKTPGSTGMLGGIFSSIFSGGGIGDIFREGGGPVEAGKAYIVGERQAELFVPNSSGTILPSVNTGNNISFNITAMDGQDVMRTLANKQREIAEMVFGAGQKYNLAGAR